MVKLLKQNLPNREQWSLLSKSLIFTLLLGAAFWSGSVVLQILFVLVSILIYALLPEQREELRISYFAAIVLPLLLVNVLESTQLPFDLVAGLETVVTILSGVIFWSILNLINFKFKRRIFAYTIVNTFLLILLFVSILSIMEPFSIGFFGLGLFVGVFLLFSEIFEFFGISRVGFSLVRDKRSLVCSLAVGFLAVQLSWIVLILPLGLINSAVLLVLIFILLRDLLIAHFEGRLTLPFILRQFTFLVLFVVIIFASSNWSI